MRVLALEPYYGGSHRAFLDGWSSRSRHEWTVLTLPAYKWKWRMRHAAITLAGEVSGLVRQNRENNTHSCEWDVLFCSDMLNLAEFLGLTRAISTPSPRGGRLPSVVYFHENQLTYPVRQESERDWHFAFTNVTTALAADAVWFNSGFHRDSFLTAADDFLKRMPDYQPTEAVEQIRAKSAVHYPGVQEFPPRGPREPGPLRVLWAARWEHDKNPETFFEALELLRDRGIPFRISVIGESFREVPAVFGRAKQQFASHIDRWGYMQSRRDYEAALREADVMVSTANHEFFGISVVEAVAAGAYPLVPDRLAYPEIIGRDDPANRRHFIYDGSAARLSGRLAELAQKAPSGHLWPGDRQRGMEAMSKFKWNRLLPKLEESLELVAH